MEINLDVTGNGMSCDTVILSAFQKKNKDGETDVSINHWPCNELIQDFKDSMGTKSFKAAPGETITYFYGMTFIIVGLGVKTKAKSKILRNGIAKATKAAMAIKSEKIVVMLDHFNTIRSSADSARIISEAIELTTYTFDKYLTKKTGTTIKSICLESSDKKEKAKILKAIEAAQATSQSVNVTRDFVNEPPNMLNSETYAKAVQKDAKEAFKNHKVEVKVLNKATIVKEKMGLLLSVNAGSAFEPRIVHLSYTPKKVNSKTKHIALVGKGLTFDTGGYSLKPGGSMINMKTDMAGSATVYGGFRAAVLNNSPYKLTCVMVMTDNAVNELATMPDSICTARNGMTCEILNTDAEGRLALADALDYTCDLKPDVIIDAATLTGACLVALGKEVCAVLGNDSKLADKIKKSATAQDEYSWELPIIDEWRNEMKSNIADLKNIGSGRFAGTATAAAFLENFIREGISWAHLDIAGVADNATHLPFCPSKGASGSMVRSIEELLVNGKF
jgi:leucyl aminopeptidase